MKKGTNYVDAALFEAAIVESGVASSAQAGFVKCRGAKGRNVYVARTKRVGRVDISGFECEIEGVITLGEGDRFGAVTQQLDFSRTSDEIITTFKAVLEHMKTLPDREIVRGDRTANSKGWSKDVEASAAQNSADRESRLELIRKVAAEKGVSVSTSLEE